MNEKIILTADWHLTDRQYGRSWRSEDFFRAAQQVIQLAHDNKVATIINAGDMLNVSCPASRVVDQILTLDTLLQRYGIRMLVISGNHDMTEPPWATVLTRSNDRSTYNTGVIPFDNQKTSLKNGVQILGLPYMRADELRARLKEIRNDMVKMPPVLAWHGMVKEFTPFSPEGCISIDDFPEDLHTVLLGDLHISEVRRREGLTGTFFAYPGSIETVSSSEPREKSVMLLEIDDTGHVVDLTRLPLNTRPYITDVLIKTEEEMCGILQQVDQAASTPVVTGVKCLPDIVDPSGRIKSAIMMRDDSTPMVDPVVRITKVSTEDTIPTGVRTGAADESIEAMLDMTKLLNVLESPGTEAYTLMLDILGNRADYQKILDMYVSDKLNKLEKAE